MKNRHFGGVQVFQIISHGAKRVAPKKKNHMLTWLSIGHLKKTSKYVYPPFLAAEQ